MSYRATGSSHRNSMVVLLFILASVAAGALWSWAPAGAAKSSRQHVVSAAAYFEATPKNATYDMDNVKTLLLVKTPPLAAGNYLATGTITGSVPLSTNNTDYLLCYLNLLPNRTSTYQGHYAWGYNGPFTLNPEDAFVHLAAGKQIGVYCFENNAGANAQIDEGTITVTRYPSISAGDGS